MATAPLPAAVGVYLDLLDDLTCRAEQAPIIRAAEPVPPHLQEEYDTWVAPLGDMPLLRAARLFLPDQDVLDAACKLALDAVGTPDLSKLPFEVCLLSVDLRIEDDITPMVLCLSRTGDFLCYDRLPSLDGVLTRGFRWTSHRLSTRDGWEPAALETLWAMWFALQVPSGPHVRCPVPTSVRRILDRARQAGMTLPPPSYYTIPMPLGPRTRGIPETLLDVARPHLPPGYRFDVRGHDRYYVRIASTDAEVSGYRRLGYTVRPRSDLPDVEVHALGVQDAPPDAQIALKVVRVREHQKGSGDYVPALRTPKERA